MASEQPTWQGEVQIVFPMGMIYPRMRWKPIQCPVMSNIGPVMVRCPEMAVVFFQFLAWCPVHGLGQASEPWTEPSQVAVPDN